jgi:hypothetical protein
MNILFRNIVSVVRRELSDLKVPILGLLLIILFMLIFMLVSIVET